MYNAAVSAVDACEKMEGCSDGQQTLCLQRKILEYFNGEDDFNVPNNMGKSRLVQFALILKLKTILITLLYPHSLLVDMNVPFS